MIADEKRVSSKRLVDAALPVVAPAAPMSHPPRRATASWARDHAVVLGFLLVIERTFVYDWDMSAALTTDELDALDPTPVVRRRVPHAFIEVRQRDRSARKPLHGLLLCVAPASGSRSGEGASSTPMWVQFQTGTRRDARLSSPPRKRPKRVPLVVAKAWAQGEISANAAGDGSRRAAGRS